jgi:hypothetical protein
MSCRVDFLDPRTAASASATWSRFPNRPSWAPPVSDSFPQHSSDNNFSVNLVIRNTTREFDDAEYRIKIEFSGQCSYICGPFNLKVRDECYERLPQPLNRTNVTVTTTLGAPTLKLAANFTGDRLYYGIVFSNSTVTDLPEYGKDKYSTRLQALSQCVFTAELTIQNLSMADAGLYTARAVGLDNHSSDVFFDVRIIDRKAERSLLPLIALVLLVMSLVLLGVCVVHRKKNRLRCCHYPLILALRNVPYTQQVSNHPRKVLVLYCKTGLEKNELEDLMELLELFPGIELHVDLRVKESEGEFPENWSRWMEVQLCMCGTQEEESTKVLPLSIDPGPEECTIHTASLQPPPQSPGPLLQDGAGEKRTGGPDGTPGTISWD